MKRLYLLTTLLLMTINCQAQLKPETKKEIEHLFTYLEQSGCQFERNGDWHEAKDASAHLQKKYHYLLENNLLASAEDFIARAGSESSMSGKAYHVKCNGNEVESKRWFSTELTNFRKNKADK